MGTLKPSNPRIFSQKLYIHWATGPADVPRKWLLYNTKQQEVVFFITKHIELDTGILIMRKYEENYVLMDQRSCLCLSCFLLTVDGSIYEVEFKQFQQ